MFPWLLPMVGLPGYNWQAFFDHFLSLSINQSYKDLQFVVSDCLFVYYDDHVFIAFLVFKINSEWHARMSMTFYLLYFHAKKELITDLCELAHVFYIIYQSIWNITFDFQSHTAMEKKARTCSLHFLHILNGSNCYLRRENAQV